jgi:enoyl-CoA hydratase/carnithine racemase
MDEVRSEHVAAARQGAVLTIRLERPDKKNAIDRAMYGAMADLLRRADTDDAIRCVRFAGVPGAFSSGNDIADFMRFGATGALDEVLAFLDAVVSLAKPLVAAVDGLAIGIGTTLLLHCDRVLATPRSIFRTPFADLGLVPEAGSSLLAPRVMGEREAYALLAMGETFDVERAARCGLVTQVVDDAEVTSLQNATALAAKPPEALRITRALLRPDPTDLRERMAEEARHFAERLRSPEARAAFSAFLGKG